MKNMTFVTLLGMVVLAGCSSTGNNSIDTDTTVPQVTAVPQSGSEVSLFQEAHRCQGTVRYQAEVQRGELRSRLSCEWQVSPDEWGTW